jgi:hypothetical protein
MNRTFNNGIGMVLVVDAEHAEATAATLRGWARRSTDRPIASAAKAPPFRFADRAAQQQGAAPWARTLPSSQHLPFPPPTPPRGVVASYLLMAGALLLVMWRACCPACCACAWAFAHPLRWPAASPAAAPPPGRQPERWASWRASSCWRRCCC